MGEATGRKLHILHAHSGFNLGGKEARAVRLMNVWADKARHVILSAQPHALGARAAIAPDVEVEFPEDAPSLQGLPGLKRYFRIARYMQQFDLVLTYNWGAMDVVMAHRIFSLCMRLPPLIHHEDGFNEDESEGLKPKRNKFRRLALARAHALVVPSRRLHDIARSAWAQPDHRIRLIPNGINVAAYGNKLSEDAIPGFVRTPGKLVVGTLAGLRKVKNLPRLVRAVAPLKDRLQLVIIGEGPEHDAICDEAARLGLDDLCMPGFMAEPWRYVGAFDIFALSSDSEQFPISLVEAMAAGLPVVSTAVGDVTSMVSEPNMPFIVPAGDEAGMSRAFAALIEDDVLRSDIASANRARAITDYDEKRMIARYAALYCEASGITLGQ